MVWPGSAQAVPGLLRRRDPLWIDRGRARPRSLIAYRRAQRTTYAITSAGAHILVEGAPRRIDTYGGPDLVHFRCIERPDGSGDLVFPVRRKQDDSGGFFGVANVRHVEQVLRLAAGGVAPVPDAAPVGAAGVRGVGIAAALGSAAMLAIFGFTALPLLRSSTGMSQPAPSSPPARARQVASLPMPAPSAVERDAGACASGAAGACSSAGLALARGTAGLPDSERARPLLERGCDLGSASACRQLGWMLSKGEGIAVDHAGALARNLRGCELGSGDACSAAAFSLAYGQGVAQNRAAALGLAERACGDGSHPRACAVLGDLLMRRTGEGDRARALQVYRGCCTSGDSGCCTSASNLARSQR
jgi:hypothetical protein